MFTWIKSNPWKSAGIAIVLIYVIIAAVKKEWNPMNWFTPATAGQRAVLSYGTPTYRTSTYRTPTNGTPTGSAPSGEVPGGVPGRG